LYRDEVRERIHADIKRKMDGQDISTAEPEPQPARIIDLMEALKASLASVPAPAEAEEAEPRKGARATAKAEKAEPKRRAAKR
jgi:non-homologous end joining protein Ku